MKIDWRTVAVYVVVVTIFVWVAYAGIITMPENRAACAAKGGTEVRTTGGRACIAATEIKL